MWCYIAVICLVILMILVLVWVAKIVSTITDRVLDEMDSCRVMKQEYQDLIRKGKA